jgi:threonine dehydrogenase-like Zn-dependent dehydrogenase
MRATVVASPGTVQLTHVAVPEPGEGEVRVCLEGCGVCGSNLSPWEGRPWFKYPLAPGELGHEGWGRVDACGSRVQQLQKGDRVALLSYRAYAEYDVAPESAVVRLPEALAGKPFPGEALGCAMNVFRRCDIQPGQTVAVVGVGFLGAVLTSLSARAGARVLALSRRPASLKAALHMGAEETFSLQDPNAAAERVKALTGGKGCARVIEAAGQQATLDLATELTCERGRLIIAGYHQDGRRSVNLQLWNWRGLDVINAHERDPKLYTEGMRAAVEAVVNRQLDPSPLYTHFFPLEKLGQALDAMKERPDNFMKALVLT